MNQYEYVFTMITFFINRQVKTIITQNYEISLFSVIKKFGVILFGFFILKKNETFKVVHHVIIFCDCDSNVPKNVIFTYFINFLWRIKILFLSCTTLLHGINLKLHFSIFFHDLRKNLRSFEFLPFKL